MIKAQADMLSMLERLVLAELDLDQARGTVTSVPDERNLPPVLCVRFHTYAVSPFALHS